MSRFTGVHHVALTVRDVSASAPWYAELLGLVRLQEHRDDQQAMVLFMHPASQLMLSLHQWTIGDQADFDERRVGLDHLALHVASRDELVAWQQRLSERGIVHSPIADVTYGHVLAFRDPDGIQLELFVSPSSFWSHPTAG